MARRHSVVLEGGAVVLVLYNWGHIGAGYRGYLTGGDNGGLHIGVGAQASGLVASSNALTTPGGWVAPYIAAGGKTIGKRGLTVDMRAGVSVLPVLSENRPVAILPMGSITFGHTARH